MKIIKILQFSLFISSAVSQNFIDAGLGLGANLNFKYFNLVTDFWTSNSQVNKIGNLETILGLGGFISGTSENINFDGHKDYTDIYGRVNVFEDAERGTAEKIKDSSYGFGPSLLIKKDNITEGILKFGLTFGTYEKRYYLKLYDDFEILGNNGKYYIESYTPKIKEKVTSFYFGASKIIHYNNIVSKAPIAIGIEYIGSNKATDAKINFSVSMYLLNIHG